MKADLHVHSTASDGTLHPAELVRLALAAGIEIMAITDHDSVGGIAEALEAASGTGLRLIPAVELSAVHGALDVHFLAYFVDIGDDRLLEHLADLREARLRRAEAMVAILGQAGYDLALDEVLALSAGGAVGRSHVARALVGAGHANDVGDAFRRLIGRGKPFYVAKDGRSPSEVLETVRATGGISVLAHPGVTGVDHLVPGLLESGLRGIEAYHADHTIEQRRRYATMASELGLLATGGSDYHGPAGPGPGLGAVDLPDRDVLALLDAGAGR